MTGTALQAGEKLMVESMQQKGVLVTEGTLEESSRRILALAEYDGTRYWTENESPIVSLTP